MTFQRNIKRNSRKKSKKDLGQEEQEKASKEKIIEIVDKEDLKNSARPFSIRAMFRRYTLLIFFLFVLSTAIYILALWAISRPIYDVAGELKQLNKEIVVLFRVEKNVASLYTELKVINESLAELRSLNTKISQLDGSISHMNHKLNDTLAQMDISLKHIDNSFKDFNELEDELKGLNVKFSKLNDHLDGSMLLGL